jgi:hypothetical protein
MGKRFRGRLIIFRSLLKTRHVLYVSCIGLEKQSSRRNSFFLALAPLRVE